MDKNYIKGILQMVISIDDEEIVEKATKKEESTEKVVDMINRMKNALGIKTDRELAKSLGLSQQAIAGAKRRTQIPSSWLRELSQKGVSADYVLFGRRIESPTDSAISMDSSTAHDRNDSEIPTHPGRAYSKRVQWLQNYVDTVPDFDENDTIANELIKEGISLAKYQPNRDELSVFRMYVKHKIIKDAILLTASALLKIKDNKRFYKEIDSGQTEIKR